MHTDDNQIMYTKTACKMQTNASQNLQCNFISHNNQMNALCMHFACIWSIVFQLVNVLC